SASRQVHWAIFWLHFQAAPITNKGSDPAGQGIHRGEHPHGAACSISSGVVGRTAGGSQAPQCRMAPSQPAVYANGSDGVPSIGPAPGGPGARVAKSPGATAVG